MPSRQSNVYSLGSLPSFGRQSSASRSSSLRAPASLTVINEAFFVSANLDQVRDDLFQTRPVAMVRVSALLMTLLLLVVPVEAMRLVYAKSSDLSCQTAVPSLAPMLEKVMPAIVSISVSGHISIQQDAMLSDPFFRQLFGDQRPRMQANQAFQAAGSGVVIDQTNGLIVTSNHVIENADEIVVSFINGEDVKARLIGSDPLTDIAVLQAKIKGLQSLPLGDSDKLRVGDAVVAVGNPFGLSQTVTSGIVSALGRSGLGIERYENFIQTDASINPGNSGGALVDMQGRLIGINTAIVGDTGGSVGIGFAIPVNMMSDIVSQLARDGRVRRGQLRIVTQDLTPEIAEAMQIRVQSGVVVAAIAPDASANSEGLRVGDVLMALNGDHITSGSELTARLGMLLPGSKVKFRLNRDGLELVLDLVLEDAGSGAANFAGSGLLDGTTFTHTEDSEGAVVDSVLAESLADVNGLRQGDVILTVNGQAIKGPEDVISIASADTSAVVLKIKRGTIAMLIFIQ